MPPRFQTARFSRLPLLLCCALLPLAACEKQTPPRQQGMDDTTIRQMVENTAAKALPAAGIATRQLRVSADPGRAEEKARELVALAEQLGGTALTSTTPTGEPTVLASLPGGGADEFCKNVTGRSLPAGTAPKDGEKQLVEVIIEQ
jgi:hypothetical protein